ncbi:MAG TPA: hypothetical protein DD405_07755 [Desulfobacteraceae bacterium]|nr:hypothetical protein [Desulfobacteraceae bacterium]
MAACAVHHLSNRAANILVIINCSAIPENLLESELFGHEKGAFTDATGRKIGKFEQADQGNYFFRRNWRTPPAPPGKNPSLSPEIDY